MLSLAREGAAWTDADQSAASWSDPNSRGTSWSDVHSRGASWSDVAGRGSQLVGVEVSFIFILLRGPSAQVHNGQ